MRAVQVLNDNSNVTAGTSTVVQGEEDASKHAGNTSEEDDALGFLLGHEDDVVGKENVGPPLVAKDKAKIAPTENEHLDPDLNLNAASLVEAGGNGLGSPNKVPVFSGVERSSVATTASADGNGGGEGAPENTKAGDDRDGNEQMEDAISTPLAEAVADLDSILDSELTDFTRDGVTAGGEATLNKQQHTAEIEANVKPPTSEIAVDVSHKAQRKGLLYRGEEGKEESPTLVTTVAIESTPLLAVDRSREYSATRVTKHIRGYLARRKVARVIHRIRFTAVARDAASAASARKRSTLMEFGEPAQLSVPQIDIDIGDFFDLTYDGSEESCYNDSFSFSTIHDGDSVGELALKDAFDTSSSLKSQAGLSNQMSTDAGVTNAHTLEITRAIILSSEEEEGNDASANEDHESHGEKSQAGLSNQMSTDAGVTNAHTLEILRAMTLSSEEEEGNDASANEDHESDGETDPTTKGYSLAESISPSVFADDEISASSGLFEKSSFDKAAGMKLVPTRTASLPKKLHASPVACGPGDGVAFSCSKSDAPRSDVSQSIAIESKEQDCPQHIHAPGSSTTEYDTDDTDNGTVVYLGTCTQECVQVDSDNTRAEESKARADRIGELEAIFKELQLKTDFEQQNDLLEKELLKSKHLQAAEISLLKERHSASCSLFRRQLSILKAKYSTALSEKLAAEAKVVDDEFVLYLLKENTQISAQILMLKGENETLVFQKLAAEAKAEWVRTKLAAAVFGWIQFSLALLVLSM